MPLRTALRSGGTAPVSFFAFQDIIFSATGIFLLISILMTLFGKMDMLSSELLAETPELKQELETLAQRKTSASAKLFWLANLDEPDATSHDMPSALTSGPAELNPWLYTLKDLAHRNQNLRATTNTAYQALTRSVMSMNRAEHRLEQLQAGLYTFLAESNQAIVREGTPHDFKEPVFIILKDGIFTILFLGRSDLKQEFESLSAFEMHINETYRSDAQTFLIYVKPSGISQFDPLRSRLRTLGFGVGYEPLPEDFEFQ